MGQSTWGSTTSHHFATHRIIIIPLHHNQKLQNQNHTVKMQFTTIIAPFLALAAAASAQYNGTAPSGTAMSTASASGAGTGSNPTTSPIDNGANNLAGSALGLVIAGGVALAL